MKMCCTLVLTAVLACHTANARELVYETAPIVTDDVDLYRAALSSVFRRAGMPSGGFHMLTISSEKPEEIIYVDAAGSLSGVPSTVIHLVASEHIGKAIMAGGFSATERIKATRVQQRLPAADSMFFDSLWTTMIRSARPRNYTLMRKVQLDYHFATCHILTGCIGAVVENPEEGSLSAALVEVGLLLKEFVLAKTPKLRAEKFRAAREAAASLQLFIATSGRFAGAPVCADKP
jgi:hypothetical protein